MAGGAAVTGCAGTVVDVLAAVVTRPAVDADAVVAAVRVVARSSVLTGVWHQLTLVHVFGAVLACEQRQREYDFEQNLHGVSDLRSKLSPV